MKCCLSVLTHFRSHHVRRDTRLSLHIHVLEQESLTTKAILVGSYQTSTVIQSLIIGLPVVDSLSLSTKLSSSSPALISEELAGPTSREC